MAAVVVHRQKRCCFTLAFRYIGGELCFGFPLFDDIDSAAMGQLNVSMLGFASSQLSVDQREFSLVSA